MEDLLLILLFDVSVGLLICKQLIVGLWKIYVFTFDILKRQSTF